MGAGGLVHEIREGFLRMWRWLEEVLGGDGRCEEHRSRTGREEGV